MARSTLPSASYAVHPASLLAGFAAPAGAYDADILILALNRPLETISAIESAASQMGGSFHVSVLDQGSSEVALAALFAFCADKTNIALYRSPSNLGVAGGRNLAACLGHGTIIIGLDNDAVFADMHVAARAVTAFATRPALGALAFNILAAGGTAPDLTSWGYPKPLLHNFRERFDTTTFVGAGHAIRRTTWTEAGGYDESFFFTWEEYDFCLRAIARGWIITYDGSLAVIHTPAAEARVTWSSARLKFYVRNRLRIGRKWGLSWVRLTPRILGFLLKALLNRQLGIAWAGVSSAFGDPVREAKPMSMPMRAYLYANEYRYRGGIFDRLRDELLAPR
jgi:GT2 family glycosyltransferase